VGEPQHRRYAIRVATEAGNRIRKLNLTARASRNADPGSHDPRAEQPRSGNSVT
jgi:hypothetical protein